MALLCLSPDLILEFFPVNLPQFLFIRLVFFVFKYLFFRAAGALAFLTADFFDPHPLGRFFPLDPPGNFVNQEPPRQKAVQRLGTGLLASDFNPCGGMDQLYARRGFVDLLAPGAGTTDEIFHQILFPNVVFLHPGGQIVLFGGACGKCRHEDRYIRNLID